MPFVGNPRQHMPKGIAFSLQDYCGMVLDAEQWLSLSTEFEKHFCYAAGAEKMMNSFKAHTGHQRMRGMEQCKKLLAKMASGQIIFILAALQ
jgi:hypothetical protein